MSKHTQTDGTHRTAIPSLFLIRAASLSEPVYTLFEPALCIIAQGAKLISLEQVNYRYDPASYLVASLQLPIVGQILEASSELPYLSVQLSFNFAQILDIIQDFDPVHNEPSKQSRYGMAVNRTNTLLLDAVLRLVRLLDTPEDIPILAPLIIRELLYRVLKDEQGSIVKQFVISGSQAQRVADVIEYIKQNYDQPLNIAQLAKQVNMSVSSLHYYFKEFTAMSPLQYQKKLRLQEARRLLLSGAPEAADVAYTVGYESPSQFSREYARMFGLPPISDLAKLRQILGGDSVTIKTE
ncbi:AraC family transcriptional regulator [Paenibacillus gorillae]|uniref:AraC family transcriptional regulator n=1 Tax=Paenibacillus gorillae TaxID=1243662 RepID=UPI00307BE595